jgi:hypothetical protein
MKGKSERTNALNNNSVRFGLVKISNFVSRGLKAGEQVAHVAYEHVQYASDMG